ncbi:hypothetical protein [Parvularcula sp. IMCC14364]|uniref:DUF7662 domain-containing protein n=1 Tax=Parvularcula sp. IMCC14364 TaxID=3067902 RepID=UPI0027415AB0|nr:hypothetical protein [Parvularcula sp. IMCC14364]
MSKYAPLQDYLERTGALTIPMTFEEIEQLVGEKLPASAYKHRPWWSNNPSNSVITHAWLAAGYKTAKVDMASKHLVFTKREDNNGALESNHGGGNEEQKSDYGQETMSGKEYIASFYGKMEFVVRVTPETDLTSPTGEVWDAEEGRL